MVTFRIGSKADFPAAVEVWRLANTARRGGEPVPEAHEQRVAGYADVLNAFLVVAEDEGDLVGMALGMQANADDGAGPPIPGLCHISMMFVHPDRWGRGIGSGVLRSVMEHARAGGFERVQLWTHADNERARRLYERRGFTRSGREKLDDLGELIVHYERVLDPSETREATLEDAPAIARAHVLSWQTAYRGLVPDDYLDSLSIDRRATVWTQILTDASSRGQRILIAGSAEVEAFICVGPSRDTDVDPARVGELQALYAVPSAWGRGMGHSLHEHGIEWFRSQGKTEATLWVVVGNARAIRFYERHGWRADGATKHEVWDGAAMDELRLRLRL